MERILSAFRVIWNDIAGLRRVDYTYNDKPMTPEQRAKFDAAFIKMDEAFDKMNEAFKGLRP